MCAAMICVGWLLFIHVPCLVVRESIRQHTVRLRSRNAQTANYDATMGSIQSVHETTVRAPSTCGFVSILILIIIEKELTVVVLVGGCQVRLSALLTPPLLGMMFACLMLGGFWLMIALAPTPPDDS